MIGRTVTTKILVIENGEYVKKEVEAVVVHAEAWQGGSVLNIWVSTSDGVIHLASTADTRIHWS